MLQEEEGELSLPELPEPYFFAVRPWRLFYSGAEFVRVELRKRRFWKLPGSTLIDWSWGDAEEYRVSSDAEVAVVLARYLAAKFERQRRTVDLSGLS